MNATPSPAQMRHQQSDLALRRGDRSWNFFRVVLGLAGAAFVVLPVTSGNSYALALVGLIMFVAAILLPPAKPQTRMDAKARELGALAVVKGGQIRFRNSSSPVGVRLFVGSERVSVLDSKLQLLFEIPASEIVSAHVGQAGNHWVLELQWAAHTANFVYRGFFAERRARAAEDALRRVMRPAVPALVQRRAAGA